jgi:hypothetical protein
MGRGEFLRPIFLDRINRMDRINGIRDGRFTQRRDERNGSEETERAAVF